MSEIPLDMLLGRVVRTRDGARVGRIHEIELSESLEVLEFLVGQQALMRRLSALGLIRRKLKGFRIRWDQIDISDPVHPRLTCAVDQLKPL
jgi:hypothetical protein